MERKVTFYLLSATEKRTSNKASREMFIQHFKDIYENKMENNPHGGRIAFLDIPKKDKVSIEILKHENELVYIKLGQKKPKNTLSLRNESTYQSTEIDMEDHQYLEMNTYAMIDFKKMIVAFISLQGAPTVSNIPKFINRNSDKISIHTSVILTKDIIKMLCAKQLIGTIHVKATVPSDRVLSEMGVSWDAYGKSESIETSLMTFEVRAKRGNNLFSESAFIKDTVDEIKSHFGDKLKKILVRAKDDGEQTKEYDLASEHFTKTIYIGDRADAYHSDEEFITELRTTYLNSVGDLENFTR